MENTIDIDNLSYYKVTDKNPIYIKLNELKGRKCLYHYTNKASAENILKSNTFYVTHSNFLLDKTELKYIAHVLTAVLGYLRKTFKEYNQGIIGEKVSEYIVKSLIALKKQYEQGIPVDDGDFYILSLTERKNNKYLLENYCGEGGEILEINDSIVQMLKDNKYLYTTFTARVVYDLKEQMELIIKDINEFYYELCNVALCENVVNYSKLAETVRSVLYIKIVNYSFFFKDIEYSKENEYRVVFLIKRGMEKYREKNGSNIPYIEVEFKENSIFKTNYSKIKFF